jgi:hypothetical protein
MIDLHVHTTHSDGTSTPGEVIRYAKEKGLAAIAITDHDCISGVNEAQETGKKIGVDVISGVEFSTNFEMHNIPIGYLHIIGLLIDIHDTHLNEKITKQTEAIEKGTEILFDKLVACGFKHISYDEFRSQGSPSSKGHFKRYMDSANIYHKELGRYVGKDGLDHALSALKGLLTVADTIDVIHKAGGIAVWAHPLVHKLNPIELEQTVMTFKAMGLDGVEAYYPGLTQEDFSFVVDLAAKHQLLISGGSDFHGDARQNDLGASYQNERIPFSVLNAMLVVKNK